MPGLQCSDLAQLTAGHERILLLLDFDGTLSEIVPRAEDAVLREGNRSLLGELSACPSITCGILSGRALEDVAKRVDVPGLVYGGNHGLEIRGPGIDYLHPEASATVTAIAEAASHLNAALSPVPGAAVEDKRLTLTVHYRRSPPELHGQVQQLFFDSAQPLVDAGVARISNAKMALELRPAVAWDKGQALLLIHSRLAPDAVPVYVGDDATDEDAFKAAQSIGGIGVFVGPAGAQTCASARLVSPADVSDALAGLLPARRGHYT